MEKKIPERTCIGCRTKKSQSDMLRIAALKSGEIKVNVKSGRGAYICKDIKCLGAAKKKGSLSRALRCQTGDEVYTEISKLIEE